MKKEKFIFTIVFTLLTGIIIGSIATYILKPVSKRLNFEKHHAEKIRKVIKKLNLNEEQEKQFYNIHVKYLTRMCSVMKKTKPDMIKIIEEETSEICTILTPEQQKEFKEKRAKLLDKFKTKFANAELFKQELQK